MESDAGRGPTLTGDLVGTPAYMSPEQAIAKSGEIGPAADLWALGVTMYEMLTGHLPFRGESTAETLDQVRSHEAVPPKIHRPNLPEDLQTICLKCLNKSPAGRYTSAAELAADLRRWFNGEAILARPVSAFEKIRRWRRRNPRLAAMTAGLALLAALALAFGILAIINLHDAKTQSDKLAQKEREGRENAGRQQLTELRRAVQLQLAEATALMNAGDSAGAAVLFVDALRKNPDPDQEELHRIRLRLVMNSCPALKQSFHVPIIGNSKPMLSADGSTVLVLDDQRRPVIWDTKTGVPHMIPIPDAELMPLEAISSNGRAIVAVKNHCLRAWDTKMGQPLQLPLPSSLGTLPSPLAPDGHYHLERSEDLKSLIIRAPDGRTIGEPMRHDAPISAWLVSKSGRAIATGSQDGFARVWSSFTGEPVCDPLPHGNQIRFMAMTPSARGLATLGMDGTIQLWDVARSKPLGYRIQHGSGIIPPQYMPNHPRLATAGWGFGVRFWDLNDGRAIGSPMSEASPIVALEFSRDGETMAVLDQNRTARLWDPEIWAPRSPILYAGVRAHARFSEDSRELLVATDDGQVRVWENRIEPSGDTTSNPNHVKRYRVYDSTLSPQGELIGIGTLGLRFSNVSTGRTIHMFPNVNASRIALDEKDTAAVFGKNNDVELWNCRTAELIRTLSHPDRILGAAFAPDGRLAVGGTDGIVRFWNVEKAEQVGPALPFGNDIHQIDWSRDGKFLLVSGIESTPSKLWNLESNQLIATLPLTREAARPLFTPGGKTILSIIDGTIIGQISTIDGRPVGPRIAAGEWVGSLTLSSDGKLLAASNPAAQSVKIWDLDTGRPIGFPFYNAAHNTYAGNSCIAFSPDRKRLAVGSTVLRVWDIASGIQITPPLECLNHVIFLRFNPDGNTIIIASSDSSFQQWKLVPDPRSVEVLERQARLLANRRLDDRGVLVPLTREEEIDTWQKDNLDR